MKMNNELKSPAAGVVEQVPVKPCERVNAGALLVALQVT
jgi:biotin carboxyl carrier protein